MFTKNPFNKKDEVADLIGNILESDYKVKKEELKGSQHKIDMNKNNKIDAHDFKLLRSKGGTQKDEEIDPNKVTTDTLKGRAVGKDANPYLSKKVFMDVPDNVKEEAEGVAEGSDHDDDYSTASFEKWKKQKEYEREYDKKKPANPIVPANNDKKKGVAEGLPQILRKIVPGYAKREIDKKMDAQKFGRTDVDKDANYYRYKKIQDKIKKQGVAEETEQIDERELTKGETKEKERIVRGMKKSLAGFKQRYGERAKSVMYATATKAAKKD